MKSSLNFLLIFSVSLIISCSKSGRKALDEGDYYNATLLAVEKLKKDSNNSKALEVLPEAYKLASVELAKTAERFKKADQQFRWEFVLSTYEKLNKMHDQINNCATCQRLVRPTSYYNEAEYARKEASKERYSYSLSLLNKNTIESARSAYASFQKLVDYAPNYQDAQDKMEDALNAGSYHVVIEQPRLNARLFEYSYAYFQNQVEDFLKNNRRMNKFIRFYSPQEAEEIKLKPDHIVRLEFIDFVVGQSRLESKEKIVESADSVKTGTVTIKGEKVDVYGKVKATLVENKKNIRSYGVMALEIYDFQSNKILLRRELPGEFNWFNEWSTFNGDERALTPQQLKSTKNREQLPPHPQDLFIEFCKPIYDQFTTQIRSFYKNY